MNDSLRNTRRLAGLAIFTAITIILQMLGSFIHLGQFSISLVLVPIVVGAALFGAGGGAWLGFVFGLVVLLSGDAALFLSFSVPGTIITVLGKGMLAGLCSGLVYRAFEHRGKTPAVTAAAFTAPVVNTGCFLIGCLLFFLPNIKAMAGDMDVFKFMIVGLVGFNFIFELIFNLVLAPVIVRIIDIGEDSFRNKNK